MQSCLWFKIFFALLLSRNIVRHDNAFLHNIVTMMKFQRPVVRLLELRLFSSRKQPQFFRFTSWLRLCIQSLLYPKNATDIDNRRV